MSWKTNQVIRMNLRQSLLIASSITLFFVIYLGCDTVSKEQQVTNNSQALTLEATSIESLIQEATSSLSPQKQLRLDSLRNRLLQQTSIEEKVEAWKLLSGFWYKQGQYAVAGHYAEEVAEQIQTDNAWSIAGTTYFSGLKSTHTTESHKAAWDYCGEHARAAFENAISLAPENLDHQINLSLLMVENPGEGGPMQGILKLRKIAEDHPEHIGAQYQLGMLSMRTNQWEKAKKRFETIITLDEQDKRAFCQLAMVYEKLNQPDKAQKAIQQCNALSVE